MIRRANLRTGKGGKKRVYSSKYALSSIVYCGGCGEIYRRVHWNNRGYKSIVWRCVSRLEEKGSDCTSPTINEETLQTAVVKAINEVLGNKDTFLSTLQENIATVLNEENDKATDNIIGNWMSCKTSFSGWQTQRLIITMWLMRSTACEN